MIYAIVWQDLKLGGIPLHLKTECGKIAIETAKDMHNKAGESLQGLRAVSLADNEDKLITLWSPAS